MNDKKYLGLLRVERIVQMLIVLFLSAIVSYYNFTFGVITLVVAIFLTVIITVRMEKKFAEAGVLDVTLKKDGLVNRNTINDISLPITIVDENGKVVWSNTEFEEMVESTNIRDKNIEDIAPRFNLMDLSESQGIFSISHRNKFYDIHYNRISQREDESKKYILYWIDRTSLKKKISELQEKSMCIGLIYIDNYEEIFSGGNSLEESAHLLEMDKKINLLGNRINALLEKLDDDKYIILFEQRYLNFLESGKFEILDEIKSIGSRESLPITVSIGVGSEGKNIVETYNYAQNAMDIALGRGGDQAVVKAGERMDFYGGRSKTVEKRTKVKARVVAHSFRKLIDQEDVVFIMGHKSPDLDCFGAAIGIYRAVKSRGKNAYIVLEGVNSSIKLMYGNIQENSKEVKDHILSPEEALLMMGDNNMCVVVDTHKPSQVDSAKVLNKAGKVVVIDHHRRGEEFIENPELSYVEPYASSTCELVTELLYYISDRMDIEKVEAEALLAGIALDTKHFSVKTGVRTFEAGAFLRRFGADTEVVRKLFRGNIENLKLRAKVIENSRVIEDHIAISKLEDTSDSGILIAAQSADELLNIENIDASFVMAKVKDDIHISARSTGDVNVQIVMEELNGGGHMNAAGTRLEGVSLDQAEESLIEIINKFIEEGEI